MCDSPPESVTGRQRPGGVYRAVPDAGRHGQTSLVWREPPAPVVVRLVQQVRTPPAQQ